MHLDDGVEGGVELVEQVDDLHGRAAGGDGGEAHDVAEEDGAPVEPLRLHRVASLQTVRHPARQDTCILWDGGEDGDVGGEGWGAV